MCVCVWVCMCVLSPCLCAQKEEKMDAIPHTDKSCTHTLTRMFALLQVGEIVDRAQKEEKMEQALMKLGETWTRVEFQFIQFKDTPVYTVKMADEDFEALEDNQVCM